MKQDSACEVPSTKQPLKRSERLPAEFPRSSSSQQFASDKGPARTTWVMLTCDVQHSSCTQLLLHAALLLISALPCLTSWQFPESQPQGCFWFLTSSLADKRLLAKPPHPLLLSPSKGVHGTGTTFHSSTTRHVSLNSQERSCSWLQRACGNGWTR